MRGKNDGGFYQPKRRLGVFPGTCTISQCPTSLVQWWKAQHLKSDRTRFESWNHYLLVQYPLESYITSQNSSLLMYMTVTFITSTSGLCKWGNIWVALNKYLANNNCSINDTSSLATSLVSCYPFICLFTHWTNSFWARYKVPGSDYVLVNKIRLVPIFMELTIRRGYMHKTVYKI